MTSDDRTEFDPEQVHEMLAQVELVQSQVRWSLLSSNWWLFLLWGTIVLGSIYPVLFLDIDTGWYWIVAGPLGAIASYAVGYRVSHDIGTTLSSWPYVVTGLAIFVGTFGTSALFTGAAAVTGVFVSLALGFSVFALLDRQYGAVSIFGVTVVLAFALATEVSDVVILYSMNAVAFGMALVALGLGLRVGRPDGSLRGERS